MLLMLVYLMIWVLEAAQMSRSFVRMVLPISSTNIVNRTNWRITASSINVLRHWHYQKELLVGMYSKCEYRNHFWSCNSCGTLMSVCFHQTCYAWRTGTTASGIESWFISIYSKYHVLLSGIFWNTSPNYSVNLFIHTYATWSHPIQ